MFFFLLFSIKTLIFAVKILLLSVTNEEYRPYITH